MKKNFNKGEVIFRIFSSVCIFLSVVAFALMSKIEVSGTVKMTADVLVIILLTVLNTAVLVLYEWLKDSRK